MENEIPSKCKLENLEEIVALAKRRGFVFPSSEIYGGLSSCYDYGPLGAELKRNVKNEWWRSMVHLREDVVGLDASILMHPRVWEASGHIQGFTDPLVECRKCGLRVREDHMHEGKYLCSAIKKKDVCDFGPARAFNLMFKTNLGPVEDEAHTVYLRPETAQGIFVNYQNVIDSTRVSLPFGIAQQGKSFRNEITTRHFTFRTCEFEQMEMEFFCRPEEMMKWYDYWCNERFQWFVKLGVNSSNLRLRAHPKEDLAHYSTACSDIEYLFPFGWGELEGVACRGDFDLGKHTEYSGKKLLWRDQVSGESFIPYVVEPALGTDRAVLTFLIDSYEVEDIDGNPRTVLKLHPRLAPTKVGVFPLLKKDGQPEKAREIFLSLKEHYQCQFDDSGNIGKRYRRQDEAGTPLCITIDHDTLKDQTVTIRDRDTLKQERVSLTSLREQLLLRLGF
ncbi:MAG TPA: glycine--tRNA ligase [Oligoflexia bacterium]|nr:glycine--tRNA ligase [Oligoflexia bacterium]HMP48833.1 glycine--tRNA ligase [Oligoflexia bacterium]